MSITSEPKSCPKCGGPIPLEAPQGLCPKCLLLQASIPTEAGKDASSKSALPTREELAAAFPQLEILELIGQGGMGFVFKARQPKIERLVALKILPQSLAADPAFAERFTREGRVLARLNHPNIVTIHDFGQANGFFYLLMEFVDGVNLRQAMKVGRFTPAQALAVVPKICEALQFAHNEGILHRDIKPENILLDSKGRVKIADFGIAKLLGEPRTDARLTGSGATLGTPHYMAPEQIEHPQDVDQRADIYSLGVVFYEMLTGELPIGRFARPSEKSAVDPRMDEVVFRTLEKERERRTQTAGEVKTQVETIATHSRAPTIPESSSSGNPKRFVRHGVVVGLLVFVLVIFCMMLVALLWPKTYRASTRLLLRPLQSELQSVQPHISLDSADEVLGKVSEDLDLKERWKTRIDEMEKRDPSLLSPRSSHVSPEQFRKVEATILLKRSVKFDQRNMNMPRNMNKPLMTLCEISFSGPNPEEAAEIVNAVAMGYLGSVAQNKSTRITIMEEADPLFCSVKPRPLYNTPFGVLCSLVLGLVSGSMTTFFSHWRSKHRTQTAG